MNKSRIKYLVIPDWVTSQTDGDEHWLSAHQLMQLYGVSPRECIVYRSDMEGYLRQNLEGLIELRPRYDGDYTLPTKDDE